MTHSEMDAHRNQAKLTRTHSSLIGTSPTFRSSIQSLSSVREFASDEEALDVEEQKPHGQNTRPPAPPFVPILAVIALSFYIVFVFWRWRNVSVSEILLAVLIFVAVLLFLTTRNSALISTSLSSLKHMCREHGKRAGNFWCSSRGNPKSVEWLIGDSDSNQMDGKQPSVRVVVFGKYVREGVESYSNGDFYEGEFNEGMYNGSGVYHYHGNGRYEGDWVNGKYGGYGVESWARGSRYRGQYKQGKRHGFGIYKFYSGDTYAGEWCNGQSQGMGVQTCSDGSCYVGEFKLGVKHGLGCYHFRNGDRYSGEYFRDKIHGFGVYHFANGHCYEGSWHEGQRQGYGLYTFRNGETRSGEWDCGHLRTLLAPQMDAVRRAVLAAKRAAENAVQLPRVDVQVKKAVAAANRAATASRVAAVKASESRIHGI